MSACWDWAVAAYGREGVAEACLELQDEHGQCVPLLLWAAWRGRSGAHITGDVAEQAAALCRIWSDEVIAPVRGVRRRLKTPLMDGDELVRLPLRENIKAVELAAERALMEQLQALPGESQDVPPPFLTALMLDFILKLAFLWSPDFPAEGLAKLCGALTKGEILQYDGRDGNSS